MFHEALESFQKGDIEKAESLCRLHINSDNADLFNLLGVCLLKKERYEEAITWIQRAIEKNAEKAPIYSSNLALAYKALGQMQAASSILKTAAETMLGGGNEKDALDCLEHAAFLLRDAGQFAEAKIFYKRMLQIEPHSLGAMNDLGLIAQFEGHYEESTAYFKKILELNPLSAYTYNNLGISYQMLGKSKEAVVLFEKALDLDANLSEAHINLANLFAAENQEALAESHLRKALELQPNHPGIHNNLGIILHAQGKTAEAIPCFEKALALDPNFLQAEQNLLYAKGSLT